MLASNRVSFTGPRGGMRVDYEGHTYVLDKNDKNGKKYFKCENHINGCGGRVSWTASDGYWSTKEHTCGSTALSGVRQRAWPDPSVRLTPQPNRAFQPIRHEPQPGPSHDIDSDSDDDEAVVNPTDDPFIQLQIDHIRQKMEIGNLRKQKLQLEIQLLKNRG